jgi:hypothetical protein
MARMLNNCAEADFKADRRDMRTLHERTLTPARLPRAHSLMAPATAARSSDTPSDMRVPPAFRFQP